MGFVLPTKEISDDESLCGIIAVFLYVETLVLKYIHTWYKNNVVEIGVRFIFGFLPHNNEASNFFFLSHKNKWKKWKVSYS